jgi:gas vesicle protein
MGCWVILLLLSIEPLALAQSPKFKTWKQYSKSFLKMTRKTLQEGVDYFKEKNQDSDEPLVLLQVDQGGPLKLGLACKKGMFLAFFISANHRLYCCVPEAEFDEAIAVYKQSWLEIGSKLSQMDDETASELLLDVADDAKEECRELVQEVKNVVKNQLGSNGLQFNGRNSKFQQSPMQRDALMQAMMVFKSSFLEEGALLYFKPGIFSIAHSRN